MNKNLDWLRARMARACVDCGWSLDYFVVLDEVWSRAGLRPSDYCCLTCLERRLGRPLWVDDFTPCLINRLAFASAGRLAVVLEKERKRGRWGGGPPPA
jgi:hypothetical protein